MAEETPVPRDVIAIMTAAAKQGEQISQLAGQMKELAAAVQRLAVIEANRERDREIIEDLAKRLKSLEDTVVPRMAKVDSMYSIYHGAIAKFLALAIAAVGTIIFIKK